MADTANKDKIIDVSDVELVEESETTEDQEPEEVAATEEKEETITRTVPSTVQLTDFEFSSLSKTFTTMQRLKGILKEKPHLETQDQINFLEVSIWDDIVKRFGFASVEEAKTEGYDFNIKTVHVIECKKK